MFVVVFCLFLLSNIRETNLASSNVCDLTTLKIPGGDYQYNLFREISPVFLSFPSRSVTVHK